MEFQNRLSEMFINKLNINTKEPYLVPPIQSCRFQFPDINQIFMTQGNVPLVGIISRVHRKGLI